MWNHSSNPNAKCSPVNDGGSYNINSSPPDTNISIDRVEKSLDLTNYLKFLQNLFNKSTSDSESDDEAERKDQDEQLKLHSQSPSPTEIKNQNKFLSSVAADSTNSSSSNSEISTAPSQSSKSATELALPHSLADFVNDSSDSSSTSSSSFSSDDDDEGSLIPSDLTPMSDLELNNLLKKTSYPLGSDVDPMSFDLDDTTTDSDKKKHNKKKKKKSKNKNDDSNNQRQNKPNSGGKGNGPRGGLSGFGGEPGGPGMDSPGSSNSTGFDSSSNFHSGGGSKLCKNRVRKQSLKILRNEEAAAAGSSSSSGEVSLRDLKIDMLDSVSDDVANAVSSDISSNSMGIGFTGFLGDSTVDKCTVNVNQGLVCNSMEMNCSSTMGLPVNSVHENNDDDNDSLSDYMSMAATAAASTAQVPPLPHHACNSSDSFFKFDDSVCNGPSGGSGLSSITSSTIATENSNLSLQSKVIEQRKRKRETVEGPQEFGKHTKSAGQKQAKLIEMLNIKRRKIYIYICKKEIPKTQRVRTNVHKEVLTTKRRLAQACTRFLRQKAIQSQKVMKESVWRAKRLTREMQAYWKQADRVERDIRRRREKEADEQRKLDVELMEAKRQQRKLNFLITQTELYAHFMSKKLSGHTVVEEDESKILTQLNEEQIDKTATFDDYDWDAMKNKAKANVQNAFKAQQAQVQLFDIDLKPRDNLQSEVEEYQQPDLFNGVLKHYQLKGMNWLINLYDQGINGILADEMGLGKTVQSIAFLAHISERYNVWGPFLVIAPASTLHNWQQELKRFVHDFKVVPYWGNPQERKILRQFWQQSNLHTPEASFHVVVTSYQIVMADLKYFNKIKWQYLILDEAQAIKSTASARWKTLLGFSCRNRLLLTGTPIQNTMGELWALLHFIMPSLFDSHDEFNDWFSKDIESHAENKSLMDERHLSRLHLILKPFMLRRIKKDVENELSDKIEKLVPCSLTTRQRYLYSALKKKIKIDDLLKFSGSTNSTFTQHATTNLMNLVMQFRKVCNHPDLFERREVRSPYHMKKVFDHFPKLIFRDGILAHSVPSKLHILENKFSIFNPININQSLFHRERDNIAQRRFPSRFKCEDLNVNTVNYNVNATNCEWSFLRFLGLSPGDMWMLYCDGLLERLRHLVNLREQYYKIHHDRLWNRNSNKNSSSFSKSNLFLLYPDWVSSFPNVASSTALKNLVFTSTTDTFYTWGTHKIISIPETLEHRVLRSKKAFPGVEDPPLVPEIPYTCRQPNIRNVQSTYVPTFLYHMCPKAASEGRQPYFYDRSAVWWLDKYRLCSSTELYNYILYGTTTKSSSCLYEKSVQGLISIQNVHGWSRIIAPDKEKLVTDSGKLKVLDRLLKKLKANEHRVLIYSQMTKMIDLLEEFMWFRKWTYIRLDGSSKIAERRDMVADFQSRSDIFVFLLSTRAGGLGINLTAADTVIFYDSDWNPTVDQQAMDRAHRLGQTKQVTVYRLICKGTIEERILQRAKEKNEIHRMVISGSNSRSDSLKPKEVLSLLLDDEELEKNYRQKSSERKTGVDEKSVEVKLYLRQEFSTKEVGSSSEGIEFVEPVSKYPIQGDTSVGKSGRIPTGDVLESNLLKLNQTAEEGSSGGSVEGSLPPSPNLSEVSQEMETDMGDMEYQEESAFEESLLDVNPSSSSYFDEYPRTIDWNSGSVSDYDEDLSFIPKKPKMGRGTGKRGRPPSRVRVQMRELDSGQLPIRRGPGRPRLRPIGPANQGIRGRRPGRPPLSKKAETISSSLTPLTPSQRVFGMYSSPDLNLS